MRKLFLIIVLLCACGNLHAQRALSFSRCADVAKKIEADWLDKMRAEHKQAVDNECFESGDLKLKIKSFVYGEKPYDGRSLYISLHGGGGTTEEINNQQWRNQMYLYKPKEGVYVAPRAPWDAWNMWFQEGIDELYEKLIQAAVALWDVNPDKVYIMGYSAGGDGVWRMAPRMADRWAAASMMAGHPGEASQVNLRNTPYMIWMGEHDAAYDRNRLAVKHGAIMDSLQKADPAGYIHETHIIKGKGHWMERIDTLAVPWMAQFRRNPYPEKVVWRQELVVRDAMYWLSAPKDECQHGKRVVVSREGNVIDIEECDYTRLTIYLNDMMCNLDKPVEVRYKGEPLFKGRLRRTRAMMQQTLSARGDLRYMFPTAVEVELPKEK
ncbi:MAG: alpha/beta hydrolase [Alistipes sp.]|nr:alpha/beta hydrolase [Alistipes sp.]